MRTSWQWHGYLRRVLVHDGRPPLRLNLDETSIVLNHDDEKGVVSQSSKGKFVLVKKKSKKRGSLTHVAMVCDDTAVQPLLPQFIIGNESVLRVTDLSALETCLPKNVIVIRAKSSWVTVELFIVILEMLRKILTGNNIKRLPILLLDCCPVHLHAHVWRAAKKNYIFLCFVPTHLTWLLQPLDVKILRRMKAHLRGLYRRCQIHSKSALVPVVQIIKNLVEAIRKVLQGSAWGNTFDVCGYSSTTSELTSSIKRMFLESGATSYAVELGRPTEEEVLNILPLKRKYDLKAILCEPVVPSLPVQLGSGYSVGHASSSAMGNGLPAASSTGFPGRLASMTNNTEQHAPIASRTRSHSRLLLAGEDSGQVTTETGSVSPACPSSMPALGAATHPRTPAPKRPRAMAMPRRK